MFRRIDRSRFLIRLLARISTFLARKRGLPIVVGIVLLVIGAILELVNLSVGAQWLEALHIVVHTSGLVLALVGLLLSNPLGQ